jgi:hypothetical protein
LRTFALIVAIVDPVDPDDGQDHVVADAGFPGGAQQSMGGLLEEGDRRPLPVVLMLLTSTTVSAPLMAATRPVPVLRSTPADREMGTTGQPRVRRAVTSGAPTAPVAPATTTAPRRLGAAEG